MKRASRPAFLNRVTVIVFFMVLLFFVRQVIIERAIFQLAQAFNHGSRIYERTFLIGVRMVAGEKGFYFIRAHCIVFIGGDGIQINKISLVGRRYFHGPFAVIIIGAQYLALPEFIAGY